MKKNIIFSIVLILIVCVAVAGVYYLEHRGVSYTATNTPNKVLMEQNQDFNSAKAFQKQGEYAQALASYQKALPQAVDTEQKAQIEYDVAYMTEKNGDHLGSIQLFKNIAANPDYDPIVRAYSVEEIGLMYSNYADSSAIMAETFKDAPYNSFTNNDTSLTYRKLYEYAGSIYPLAISEARIADWYSNDLRINQKGATTTPDGATDLSAVQQALEKSSTDVQRIKNDPVESSNIPDVYMREAIAYADLTAIGMADSAQTEQLFQQSIDTNAAMSLPVPFVNLYYANFLATQYGNARITDIDKLLSAYSTKNAGNLHPSVPALFASARPSSSNSTPSALGIFLIRLSKLDPDLKIYLTSLGWHASDFTKTSN